MQRYVALKRLCSATGQSDFHLAVFGDEIAKRERYEAHSGMDAVHFYLVHRFGWTPAVARSMSGDDIRFALAEEMRNWTLPEAARSLG